MRAAAWVLFLLLCAAPLGARTVAPGEKVRAPGRFDVKVEVHPTPTSADRLRLAAEADFREGMRLATVWEKPSQLQSRRRLERALAAYRRSQDLPGGGGDCCGVSGNGECLVRLLYHVAGCASRPRGDRGPGSACGGDSLLTAASPHGHLPRHVRGWEDLRVPEAVENHHKRGN